MDGGPVRTCVACRQRRPQASMLRVVATPAGVVPVTDGRGGLPGRGASVCGTRSCIDRAHSTGALRRALRLRNDLPRGLRDRLLEIAEIGESRKGQDG